MPKSDSDKFLEILKTFSYAMLVTRSDNELRSRPMVIAEFSDDGRIRFLTRDDSGKLDELEECDEVNVALQDGLRFLSVSGHARVTKNQELIDRAWQAESAKWVGTDKRDSHVVVLEVLPTHVEYWDQSEKTSLELLMDNARAALGNDETSANTLSRHGSIDLTGKEQ